jgi:hypothetical protein
VDNIETYQRDICVILDSRSAQKTRFKQWLELSDAMVAEAKQQVRHSLTHSLTRYNIHVLTH